MSESKNEIFVDVPQTTADINRSSSVKTQKKFLRRKIFAPFLYVVITALIFFPELRNFFTRFWAQDSADLWMGVWGIWYYKNIFFLHDISGLFHTTIQLFPNGINVLDYGATISGLLALPFIDFLGLAGTYNLLVFITYTLSAIGAYFWILYRTKNFPAALFAGILYGYSPVILIETFSGNLNTSGLQWLPFAALFFHKTWDAPKISNVLLMIFFSVITLANHYVYGLMLAVYFIWMIIIRFVVARHEFTGFRIKRMTIAAIIAILIAIFVLLPEIKDVNNFNMDFGKSKMLSLSPQSYASGLKQKTNQLDLENPVSTESTLAEVVSEGSYGVVPYAIPFMKGIFCPAVGFAVILLLIVAIFKHLKSALAIGPYLLFGYVLGMGPYLKVLHEPLIWKGKFISIPYYWLYQHIGAIQRIHFPYYFAISTFFALLWLASLPVADAFNIDRINKRRIAKGLIIALLAFNVLFFIFLSIMLRSHGKYPLARVPAAYHQLHNRPEKGGLIELPIYHDMNIDAKVLYNQTVHGRSMFNGLMLPSLLPKSYLEKIRNNPILRNGFDIQSSSDIKSTDDPISAVKELHNMGFDFVSLTKKMADGSNPPCDVESVEKFLRQIFNEPIIDDGEVLIFRIPQVI